MDDLFFKSSFDLIFLLCDHFLPDCEEKTSMVSMLERHYQDAKKDTAKSMEAAHSKRITEISRSETLFITSVKGLSEFNALVQAVNSLRISQQFIKSIGHERAKQLLCEALST